MLVQSRRRGDLCCGPEISFENNILDLRIFEKKLISEIYIFHLSFSDRFFQRTEAFLYARAGGRSLR